MRAPGIKPLNIARKFQVDEMFFSTTDRRGIIRAGNDVFIRVSGYEASHLVGRAHSIVRHPDMPRAAFRVVWDRLIAGKRAVALIKNLASDGGHYWVVALFAPTTDGFVSIRFKPTSPLLAQIGEIYSAMLAEEQRVLAQGSPTAEAVDAALASLHRELRHRGFDDYDGFMRELLRVELKSRDFELQRCGLSIIRPLGSDGDKSSRIVKGQLVDLYWAGAVAYEHMSGLFGRLDEFSTLQRSLAKKAEFVDRLAEDLRLTALNAAVSAAHIGSEMHGLEIIARQMNATSSEVAEAIRQLIGGIVLGSSQLRDVIFNLGAGRLQIEMILRFLDELIYSPAGDESDRSTQRSIMILTQGFRQSLTLTQQALKAMEGCVTPLTPLARRLWQQMLELQVAQLRGRIETTRVDGSDGFLGVVTQIAQLVDDTRRQMQELTTLLNQLNAITSQTPSTAREIATAADEMEREITLLTAE